MAPQGHACSGSKAGGLGALRGEPRKLSDFWRFESHRRHLRAYKLMSDTLTKCEAKTRNLSYKVTDQSTKAALLLWREHKPVVDYNNHNDITKIQITVIELDSAALFDSMNHLLPLLRVYGYVETTGYQLLHFYASLGCSGLLSKLLVTKYFPVSQW